MAGKTYKLAAGDIKPLVSGAGGCIATDMITVEGQPVRFMYREAPSHAHDSGWRFMAGSESDAYMGDAQHHGVYDVNTIANYDPSIVPWLDAPAGQAFEKTPASPSFVRVDDWAAPGD